jgi:hypothetical protein
MKLLPSDHTPLSSLNTYNFNSWNIVVAINQSYCWKEFIYILEPKFAPSVRKMQHRLHSFQLLDANENWVEVPRCSRKAVSNIRAEMSKLLRRHKNHFTFSILNSKGHVSKIQKQTMWDDLPVNPSVRHETNILSTCRLTGASNTTAQLCRTCYRR